MNVPMNTPKHLIGYMPFHELAEWLADDREWSVSSSKGYLLCCRLAWQDGADWKTLRKYARTIEEAVYLALADFEEANR